ncbi:MAG: D-xylose ABC transporter substrate-binding protein [Alphaproteobacteria bacterium]|nr:D-xylose ABC transporter substrate-binding protein [Alphaproteobacteria bacterium]
MTINKKIKSYLLTGLFTTLFLVQAPIAFGKDIVVGVSWSNFQEERWKKDEAAIKSVLEKSGAKYISADAQSSNEKQMGDIENLIARGANVLIVLAQDNNAILPAIEKAKAEKIPVIGYDRLIEAPGVFYITFDNVEVGRMQAKEVLKQKPKGNYVYIKGSPTDPNSDFLNKGQQEVLKAAVDKGDIKIVGNQYTDAWLPDNAQKNMEQILTANNNKVDAVVAANDGTAGGAIAALRAQGMEGKVPVSGQDGDKVALNRIARGMQTVSVWKDSKELGTNAAKIALELAQGTTLNQVKGATTFKDGPKKMEMTAMLLKPIAITKDNLKVVLDAGWINKNDLCQGVKATDAPSACK